MHASRLWKDVLPLALEIVKLYMFNLATFWKTLDWDSLLNGRGDRGEALMATSSIKVNDKKQSIMLSDLDFGECSACLSEKHSFDLMGSTKRHP